MSAFRERYKLTDADADGLLDGIGKKTKEVASLFEINIGSAIDYEAILKKANEALVEITLQSQAQANTLQQQNQQLKIAVVTQTASPGLPIKHISTSSSPSSSRRWRN